MEERLPVIVVVATFTSFFFQTEQTIKHIVLESVILLFQSLLIKKKK